MQVLGVWSDLLQVTAEQLLLRLGRVPEASELAWRCRMRTRGMVPLAQTRLSEVKLHQHGCVTDVDNSMMQLSGMIAQCQNPSSYPDPTRDLPLNTRTHSSCRQCAALQQGFQVWTACHAADAADCSTCSCKQGCNADLMVRHP